MIIDIGDTATIGDVTLGETDSFNVEWYFLDLDGWEPPDSTVQMTQRAGADGGWGSPAFAQSGAFTITGAAVAPDRPTLIAAQDRLVGAASIAAQQISVTTGGATRYSVAQRQARPQFTQTGDVYTQFALSFVAEDPRKFATDLTGTTALPASTGGLTIPFTVPFAINSTVISGIVALTNPGNANGPVKIRINGPVTGPQITHVASGAQLIFASSYNLLAGNWLEIDMDARTVLENGQAERLLYVNEYGWSSFEPGGNEWAYTAISYNSSTTMQVTATPAWQ